MGVMYGGKYYEAEVIILAGEVYLYLPEVGVKIPLYERMALAA